MADFDALGSLAQNYGQGADAAPAAADDSAPIAGLSEADQQWADQTGNPNPDPAADKMKKRDWGKILAAVGSAAELAMQHKTHPQLAPVSVGSAGQIPMNELLAAYQSMAMRGTQANFPMSPIMLGSMLRGRYS